MDLLRRIRFAAFLLTPLTLHGGSPVPAGAVDEYSVKAAFVYNFTKFVEWPTGSLAADAAIVICISGRNLFAAEMEAAASGKKSAGHPLEVRTIDNARRIAECHVLFIPAEDRTSPPIPPATRGLSILTVGEDDGFLARGGMIRLRVEDGRVRMTIDVRAAERAGLRISSRLLSLAEVVK